MNVITTKGRGWQKRCWELAKAGESFEVLSLEHKHVLFLQELCSAYDCKFKYLPGKVALRFPRAHEAHEAAVHSSHKNGERRNSEQRVHAPGRRH